MGHQGPTARTRKITQTCQLQMQKAGTNYMDIIEFDDVAVKKRLSILYPMEWGSLYSAG